jgi:2-C-methyl-D-erythritol 4-phosphate cytidylyltransferase
VSDVAALIPAAGAGARLGLGPKAFVRLAGRTLLEHAVALFDGVADEIVVAVPAGREEEARALAPRARVLTGGASRQETVARLVAASDAPWLLVHDAARPFTPPEVVLRVLEAARVAGAATAALSVADTLHDVERDAPVPRGALRAVQTPQGFARATLEAAHRHALAVGLEATDDAQLVRAAGGAVALVVGSPWGHKLTGPDDLGWLEALARARRDVASPL